PDWVAATPQQYPAARYLLGRGQGDTPALARDRARADLAKNFRVSVSEESEDRVTASSQAEGKASSSRLEAETSRRITARTDQALEGSRVAEAWQDGKSRAHHALAVLDRLQAGAALRQQAARLDGVTREALDEARGADDLLVKLGAAGRAVAAQRERAEVQRLLTVVDPAGTGAPPTHELARLEADEAGLRRRVRVAPKAAEDPLGGLERAAAAALSAAGFLPEGGEAAGYDLTARLSVAEHPGAEGWHWVRGTLEVTLGERGGGVRGSHRWDVKASGQQPELARRRAADQVAKLLADDLGGVIVGFGSAAKR
ncbi:MAG: LPP20 family lipoprotein, partial [Deferrisomatales bacterium]